MIATNGSGLTDVPGVWVAGNVADLSATVMVVRGRSSLSRDGGEVMALRPAGARDRDRYAVGLTPATYTVTMAEPTATIAGAPLYMAIKRGFFAAHGISFEFVSLNQATTVEQALKSGSIQFATGGVFNIVEADAKGADYQVIETFGAPTLQLCVTGAFAQAHGINPQMPLKDMLTQLKGAKLGLNGFGSPVRIPLYYLLKTNIGVDPTSFVTAVNLSSLPAAQTAFQQGAVDLLVNSPPTCQQTSNGQIFLTTGFMPEFEGTPYQVFYGLKTWISQNPGAARGVAQAMADANAFVVNSPAAAAQILHDDYLQTVATADIQTFLETYYAKTIPPDGRMTVEGWQKVNKIMVDSGDLSSTPSADEGNMWTNMYLSGQ
jgi:NitT/TauT family transport system substrate-binding protein